MKRFLNYILILVVLVGVFGFTQKTNAVINQTGCYNARDELTSVPTKERCDAIGGGTRWVITNVPQTSDVCLNAGPQGSPEYNQCIKDRAEAEASYKAVMGISSIKSTPNTGSCGLSGWTIDGCVAMVLSKIAFVLMKIASLLVGITGVLLNWVITETIVKMSVNISGMTGINVAWKIIRDLMNIAFIFLLIYYGIKLILSQENTGNIQKFIFGIVLASLLINFSLFFTKVIIDSSNIVTIGIYDVISGDTSTGTYGNVSGLSDRMMKSLGLQNLLSTDPLDLGVTNDNNYSYLAANLLSTVLFLISAFVFFAVSIMLIVRYIVLIYLMALSPIAYMGMALPGMQKNAQEWWTTFMGQIIFAPLFMLMMLVTLTLIAENFVSANPTSLTNPGTASSTINIIFNFSLIIGFTIASLVISKKYSTQGSSYVKKLTDGATSFAGNTLLGGAARLQRNTLGRMGASMANSESIKERAANGSVIARMQLAAANKASTSSFDARSIDKFKSLAKTTGVDFGKADPKKENFDAIRKEQEKQAEAAAKRYKPNDAKYAEAKKKDEEIKKPYQDKIDALKGDNSKEAKEKRKQLTKQMEEAAHYEKDLNKIYSQRTGALADNMENAGPLWRYSANIFGTAGNVLGIPGFSSPKTKTDREALARKIRSVSKEKSKKDKLADAVEAAAKEKAEEDSEDSDETPSTSTPPPPEPPTPPTTT